MKLFDCKYRIVKRIEGERETYTPQYRPWYSPLWGGCALGSACWFPGGYQYETAFRAMLHIKNHKKMMATPKVSLRQVVWQE